MSKSKVKVLVDWENRKVGKLPTSGKYSTIAKFSEDINWPDDSWSIVIEFTLDERLSSAEMEAVAYFLVDDAPWERLKSGCVFEMYEGFTRTAVVRVVK